MTFQITIQCACDVELSLVKLGKTPSVKRRHIFNQVSIDKFNNDLSNINWTDLENSILHNPTNVNAAYDIFFQEFIHHFQLNFPLQTVKNSNKMTPRHPWMTKGLMKSCIRKSNLFSIFVKTKPTRS